MTNHNHIPTLKERLWWAITLELSEESILQAEAALAEAELLQGLKREIA